MPSFTLDQKIKKGTALHTKLTTMLSSRLDMAVKEHQQQHDKWTRAEELTLAYLPAQELDVARANARDRGQPKYTTIQIPYSYAMLMSAHTYWTSVFFARSPIHQYVGVQGEGEQQTQALEALITYQVEIGEMVGPYYVWLYDAGKYGCGIIGEYWDEEIIHYGQVAISEEGVAYQATQEIHGYTGNKIYNVCPFDFLHDPRVPIGQFQRGEFCAARKRMGWGDIKRRQRQGYFNSNIDRLSEHVTPDKSTSDGSSQLQRPNFMLETQDEYGRKSEHPAGAIFWEFYVDVIPSEWGLGSTDYPQKWCFTITEDKGLIVGASPLGYAHGKFPFSVLETEVEAYGLYNRGFPEILTPIQNTMDWLLNSHMYNVRAALNNQFIVDPSKLVIKDAEKVDAGFIWRLRPEAYGTDISKMFMQVPVHDVTQTHLTDIVAMQNLGEKTLGVNDQIMGGLSQGGRRTATEVRTSTGFGVNRLKTTSEYMSATGFSPHSRKLVQTSQQFYDANMKLRIAGDLMLEAGRNFIEVTPEMIAGSYSFVPVDGTLPVDRMAQANLWKEIFGGIRMMPPNVQVGYDWARMFGWMASLAGLKNINQFKVQVQPNGVLQQQAQMGNMVPLRNPMVGAGNSQTTATGLDALASGQEAPSGSGY